MSTFEELKDKALHAASVTADAAKQLAIISKCRVQIVAEQEKIRALYAKLGKVYYKDYVTDEEPDEAEYEPLCDSISAHYRRISRLRELMEEAKSNYQAVKKNSKDEVLNAELAKLADKHGVGPAQIPVAWAIAKGTLPIVGVTKVSHVEDAVKAAAVELDPADIAELEALADTLQINAIRYWEKEMK